MPSLDLPGRPSLNIWTFDCDLRLQRIVMGATPLEDDDCIGETSAAWLTPAAAAIADSIKREALETRTPIRREIRCKWRGSIHDFDYLAIPNLDDHGEPFSLTCLGFDLTGTDWFRSLQFIANNSEFLKRLLGEAGVNEEPLSAAAASPADTASGPYRLNDLLIDYSLHGLNGPLENVRLSRTEWLLLQQMVQAQGLVVSQKELLSSVWGPGYESDASLLHDTISRLRNRLRAAGASQQHIETVHGVGYRFRESPPEF